MESTLATLSGDGDFYIQMLRKTFTVLTALICCEAVDFEGESYASDVMDS